MFIKQSMERIDADTLHLPTYYVMGYSPLALPLGELSPQVTERVLQLVFALSDLAVLGHLSHGERRGVRAGIPSGLRSSL